MYIGKEIYTISCTEVLKWRNAKKVVSLDYYYSMSMRHLCNLSMVVARPCPISIDIKELDHKAVKM